MPKLQLEVITAVMLILVTLMFKLHYSTAKFWLNITLLYRIK